MKKLFLLPIFIFGCWACSPLLPINHTENPRDSAPAISENSSTLKIYTIDIGQGDATLVIGPTGKTMLLDAGPRDSGNHNTLPLFSTLSIDHLDWMVATHYDADHIGGLPEIISGQDHLANTEDDLTPRRGFFDRGEETEKSTTTYTQYRALTQNSRHLAYPGQTFELGLGAQAEVIVVNGRYSDGREIHLNPDEENEACIGLLITYKNFSYFTAGDLTGGGKSGREETKDMETFVGDIIGDIDVLHIGHHGSTTSTSPNFLETTKPETAIISVGQDNDYGHPHPSTLNKLEDANVTVYRTDLLGTIQISTDGNHYEISSMK